MEEEAPTRDVEYLCGLREAVSRGVEYGIALLENGQGADRPFPVALVTQARLAARQKIPLETVMRRYLAGKAVLSVFILEESANIDVQDPGLLPSALAALESELGWLLAVVTEEYRQEEQSRGASASRESQLALQVRRLLAGELLDPSALEYDLASHHLGVIIGSTEARQIIRELASKTNSRPLIVRAAEEEVWGWLGSKEALDPKVVCELAASVSSSSAPIGVGEAIRSLSGWRLTHQQARTAFSIAKASPLGVARYADISMVASAARDPVMTASLQDLYLSPLAKERDGGRTLRKTLRAYFRADRNISSAAPALEVSRQTVTNRLRQVERRLGQPLDDCAASVHTALQLEELGLLDRSFDSV